MSTHGRIIRRGAATLMAVALGLSVGPARSATLFGLVNTGELYSSADNGANWSPVSALPVHDAVALAARLSSSDLFMASASGTVYRSTNGGLDWDAVGTVSAPDVVDLAIRSSGTILLLTATGTVYESTDLGVSFTALAALTGSDFVSLGVRSAMALYALSRTGGVYESTDGGTNWVAKGAITTPDAARLRAFGGMLFVLTGAGDCYRSTDAAGSWTPVGTVSQVGMKGLAPLVTTMAAASREGHCWTSADGTTWTAQGSINQLTLTALASNLPATTSVDGEPLAGPLGLGAPWPNPWSGEAAASIPVRLEREEDVRLALYDLQGREVAFRHVGRLPAGFHVVPWRPPAEDAGVYFLRLMAGSRAAAVRRWVVLL